MTNRWEYLTGLFTTLMSVCRAYGVTGGTQHSTIVFIIDGQGRIRSAAPIAERRSIDAEARALATYVRSLEVR